MKKPSKLRSILFKFLVVPHAASAINFQFQTPSLSPAKISAGAGRSGSSGSTSPFVSIIPPEVRRKKKNGSFDAREPTSPKVSCMGHVKKTTSSNPKRRVSSLPPQPQALTMRNVSCTPNKEGKIKKMIKQQEVVKIDCFVGRKRGGKPDGTSCPEKPRVPEQVVQAPRPSLGQIKRFSSARRALSSFDWRNIQGAAVVPADCKEDQRRRRVCQEIVGK
ncbi:hypothetical protein F2P56_024270 [Juglans regia]|uniref:Uncharacterized protein At1g76070-like n=2 Tax=Juglans regia TaxID=51240 RepID=A0A6P9EWV7_JUGRE|nr:uncharacterized protein At1g76070-like [Juglans regia]KAF5454620.1 hypothetical protein F2P56_024270 [Juglans regia]